jgi:hypothetical protein
MTFTIAPDGRSIKFRSPAGEQLEAYFDAGMMHVTVIVGWKRVRITNAYSFVLGLDDAANLGAWLITRGLPEGGEKPS